MSTPTGVVVMAYGTPASPADIEPYYTHIRRGRAPTPEQLDDLRARYDAIGGASPLRAITERQVARLADALGDHYRVVLGMKHASPFIEDAVATLTEVDAIVAVVLAPHYSRGSVGEYIERVTEVAKAPVRAIESWADLDEWLSFEARAITDVVKPRSHVVFTAHSLPERVLAGDRYVDELDASAQEIAARAGIDNWSIGWQSASRTQEPWRGPDILDVIDALAADGVRHVVVCPQGFTADHLEVLYDIDVRGVQHARDRGVELVRTRMVNDDPVVLGALAERVRARA